MIERLVIIIKSEVLTITHCLGLGHETMVSAVCLSIFLLQTSTRHHTESHSLMECTHYVVAHGWDNFAVIYKFSTLIVVISSCHSFVNFSGPLNKRTLLRVVVNLTIGWICMLCIYPYTSRMLHRHRLSDCQWNARQNMAIGQTRTEC